MQTKKETLFSTGLFIMLLIVLGKVIAFAKDIVISTYFGTSSDTDAFFIALNITSILFIAFYSTVSLVFLPLYNETKIKYGLQATNLFSSNIINLYLFISFIIILLGIYFAPELVNLINASSNPINIDLTIILLRIMVLSFMFSIFISFMTAIQLSNEQYLAPHLAPIINNFIVVIAIIVFAPTYGIYVPAIAGVIAWIIQAPLHKWIVRKKFNYIFHLNLKDENIKKMGFLFFPAFLGIFIDQTNIMVDTILASGLEEGSVSALNYANRLISFASGIFVMAIMSIMYPMFSKYIINEEQEKLNTSIRTSIRLLLLVMLPITAIIFIFHHEIVSIVFQRGKFDESATQVTSSVFFFYSIGIIFLGLRELFNKVFYAQKNTKTPLFISFFAVSINIILSIILVKYMGVTGLALASSISLIIYVILQIIILHKKIGVDFYEGLLLFISKLIIAISISSYIMVTYKKYNYFHNLYLDFFIGSFIGTICFLLLLLLLKNEELYSFKLLFINKIKTHTSKKKDI
jgi:putative peptidoglycan lipid II flippase